ncbi:YggS family pyridoxal phosphate-dependent enzyme [Eubacteriaceae bacterium ES2]|nr:YggS family pyridoxal phosphate-dependent enzyme [Eubacteriaceae bacterium ES2]
MIAKNIERLKEEIPENVTLVAVTKYHDLEETKAVVAAGIRDLGESKVQDFLKKYEMIDDVRWHFIGHLQKNKVKQIIGKVYLIHSVDSLQLLEIINRESEKAALVTDVLLQLNLAEEETKYGFKKEDFDHLLEKAMAYQAIRIRGLMAMGPHTENNREIRNIFVELKQIYDKIKEHYHGENLNMEILSMGMTDDYKIAIEEGSNLVRIGRKIFSSEEI